MPTPTVHNFFSWRPKTKTSIVQHLLCCMVSVLLLFVVLLLLLFFIVLYCYCIFEIAKVPLMTSCSLSLRGKWDFFLVKENKKIKKFHLVSKRQKNIMGGEFTWNMKVPLKNREYQNISWFVKKNFIFLYLYFDFYDFLAKNVFFHSSIEIFFSFFPPTHAKTFACRI